MLVGCFGAAALAAQLDREPAPSCSVRVHYPDAVPAVTDVVVFGVGTAMARSSYDFLGAQIAARGYVAVFMDHNPGNLVKTDAGKFRACALAVKAGLPGWLAPAGLSAVSRWYLGGHSAGGQAAHHAVAADPALGDGIVSLDPYNLSGAPTVPGPALYWGFDVTTCFVTAGDAARAGYYATANRRAFWRVKRVYSLNPCGYAPKFFHCSFCDSHCPGCTNCMPTPASFFADVARSVQRFATAVASGTWSKANLTASMTTPVELFVDGDTP